MKSIPPSAARSSMATAAGSPRCSPKVIVPRHSFETCRPVRPSRVCSMAARYRFAVGSGSADRVRASSLRDGQLLRQHAGNTRVPSHENTNGTGLTRLV
jgi:hypothetical protein